MSLSTTAGPSFKVLRSTLSSPRGDRDAAATHPHGLPGAALLVRGSLTRRRRPVSGGPAAAVRRCPPVVLLVPDTRRWSTLDALVKLFFGGVRGTAAGHCGTHGHRGLKREVTSLSGRHAAQTRVTFNSADRVKPPPELIYTLCARFSP